MEFNFKGKTILVTGAGQGIGKGVCLKLVNSGAKVIAVSKSKESLDELAKKNPNIEPIAVDLDSWSETRKALSNIGPVDGLVNNAAIAKINHFFDITENDIDSSFSVNVKAAINVAQIVAKGMAERGKGSIVNISSQSAMKGHEDHTIYCGTKAALDGVTRVMALELGKYNIRTNCVNPTIVLTKMGRNWWSEPSRGEPALERIPLGRFAEVDEVADAVMFLLSDNSAMINGISLLIDGGHVASPYRASK
ncbi:L-xylulose reductase [Bemisia tabaci]|uniref:L-xylulose reductase n=1 Tax=Bemisia tabaci TaxID=7038 RepID=UPI0008F9A35B|nr:PREDICTED: L-xylulose reductase-like [Bemisia tabaci]